MGGEVGLDPKDTVKRVHHRDTENSFLSSLCLLGGRKRKLGVFCGSGVHSGKAARRAAATMDSPQSRTALRRNDMSLAQGGTDVLPKYLQGEAIKSWLRGGKGS